MAADENSLHPRGAAETDVEAHSAYQDAAVALRSWREEHLSELDPEPAAEVKAHAWRMPERLLGRSCRLPALPTGRGNRPRSPLHPRPSPDRQRDAPVGTRNPALQANLSLEREFVPTTRDQAVRLWSIPITPKPVFRTADPQAGAPDSNGRGLRPELQASLASSGGSSHARPSAGIAEPAPPGEQVSRQVPEPAASGAGAQAQARQGSMPFCSRVLLSWLPVASWARTTK
jgi:hypothetical protein